MTKEEFTKIVTIVDAAYPNQKTFDSDESIDLWYEVLEIIPFDEAEKIFKDWIKNNKWSPTISDITQTMAYQYRKQVIDYPLPDTVRRDPNAKPYIPYQGQI